jgi:hypothetical protein
VLGSKGSVGGRPKPGQFSLLIVLSCITVLVKENRDNRCLPPHSRVLALDLRDKSQHRSYKLSLIVICSVLSVYSIICSYLTMPSGSQPSNSHWASSPEFQFYNFCQ